MAVYFDHKIQAPNVGIQTDIAWHSSYPLLAVASKNERGVGGSVNLYLDEVGLLPSKLSKQNKTNNCTTRYWYNKRHTIVHILVPMVQLCILWFSHKIVHIYIKCAFLLYNYIGFDFFLSNLRHYCMWQYQKEIFSLLFIGEPGLELSAIIPGWKS